METKQLQNRQKMQYFSPESSQSLKTLSEQNGGICVTITFKLKLSVFPNYKFFKEEIIQSSPMLCLSASNVRLFWGFQLLLQK